jgi:hypothetical protein
VSIRYVPRTKLIPGSEASFELRRQREGRRSHAATAQSKDSPDCASKTPNLQAEKLDEEGDCQQRGRDVQRLKQGLDSARQESNQPWY